jgi:alanine-synthesizing transaminase
VSPNNPTGSRLRRSELAGVERICAGRGIPMVGDEVFADYAIEATAEAVSSVLEARECLTIALGGLSKSVGLPQLKLGWMALGGPARLVDEALARLEVAADAYLSVSTPVQLALPALLARGAAVRQRIAARVLLNDRTLRRAAAEHPACRVLPVEGGWTAVVQVPAVADDEQLVLSLLEQADVLVHPGYFFDFPRDGFLVLSLLPRPEAFAGGVERLFAALARLSSG